MVIKIFTEDEDQFVLEYTVTLNAGYAEIEDASKEENFIDWVVENATDISVSQISDYTSNDFLETTLWNADEKLCTYYVAPREKCKALPEYKEDDF